MLLVKGFERGKKIWFEYLDIRKKKGAMKIYLGWVHISLDLDKNAKSKLWKISICGVILLTTTEYISQTDYNDMEFWAGNSSHYFTIADEQKTESCISVQYPITMCPTIKMKTKFY